MAGFYDVLCGYDAAAWREAIEVISPRVREIDRNALRIWFAFYPLELHQALEVADDPAALARRLGLMGRWRLADQIDASHKFLYAHRYWPQVKSAVSAVGTTIDPPDSLVGVIMAVAAAGARTARVDQEMLIAMSAVGLMTLRHVGPEAFAAAPGKIHLGVDARRKTQLQVLRARAKDDSQGLLGFLRGLKKRWTITFDENEPEAAFEAISDQEIATAAQHDKREYRSTDPRCTPGEGPIPVECRAASCGTCWVGVLGGAEKLSAVVDRDERKRLKIFGYSNSSESHPLIRLACQARVSGAVSIVMPPWNGIFGKIRED